MITLPDLQRFLAPLKRKFFLIIGKALLTAINNEGKVGYYDSGDRPNPQRASMNWLGQLTDLERSQPYGFESYPIPNGTAENIIFCPDGSRSNAFVLMTQDDGYRPIDGGEGDNIFYGINDITEGQKHRIHFKNDGSVEIWAGKTNKIVIAKDGDIDIEGAANCNVTVSGNATIQVGGNADATIDGDASLTVGGGTTIDSTGDIDITAPNVNIDGVLNVTGNINGDSDVIGDASASGYSLNTHFHLGNLSYNTAAPFAVGAAGTPKPGTSPTGDASGNLLMNGKTIDMAGADILNILTSTGTSNFSVHYHNDSVPAPGGPPI